MSMQCRVNNRITLLKVRSITPKEEFMEAMEDTNLMVDIEAKEEVEEHLARDEDRSSVITVDNKGTSHETI